MGHVKVGEIVEAVDRVRQAAWDARFAAEFEISRAVRVLLSQGLSQREVAKLLHLSKSKVNRYANEADAYAERTDYDSRPADAIEAVMWGPGDLRARVDSIFRQLVKDRT